MNLAYSTGLDLLVVAVFAVCILLGVRRGLIRSIISLAGSIVALILALVFSSSLGGYIDANYINAPMREWLINQLSPAASTEQVSSSQIDFDDLFANRPQFFTDTCEFLNIDADQVQEQYRQLKTDGIEQAKSAIVTTMVDPLSSVISRVIAFAVIFIAAMLAIFIISLFSRFLNNLPIIRKMDKLGGGLLGAVVGLLITFILVAIISTGSKYFLKDSSAEERTAIRDKTVLYKIFYTIDPLRFLFEN